MSDLGDGGVDPLWNTVNGLATEGLNDQIDKYHAQRLQTLKKKYPVQFRIQFTDEELQQALVIYEKLGFDRSVSAVEETLDNR
jgi:hypothetical protein